jgi:hypothetical protein
MVISNNNKSSKQSPKLNLALKNLDILVGTWNTELSNAVFLPNPSDKINGQASFEWLDGRYFIVMRLPINPPDSIWVIGRDDSVEAYSILYSDLRGLSRIYEMSLKDSEWKMWRNSPGFSQRFPGQISDDHNTITAHWDKSFDGQKWEHDFDIIYTRVG